jgi:hypothetical protein
MTTTSDQQIGDKGEASDTAEGHDVSWILGFPISLVVLRGEAGGKRRARMRCVKCPLDGWSSGSRWTGKAALVLLDFNV